MPKTSVKHQANDIFLHEVANISTALTFVSEELSTISHHDSAVNELVGGLSILTGRLHRATREKIIARTVAKPLLKKKGQRKQKLSK